MKSGHLTPGFEAARNRLLATYRVAMIFVPIVATFGNLPTEKVGMVLPASWMTAGLWVHRNFYLVVLTFVAVALVARWWHSRLMAAWVWSVAQANIDWLAEDIFGALNPALRSRVTLFRYASRKWFVSRPGAPIWWPWGVDSTPQSNSRVLRNPFSGWLTPVLRSGHATKNTKTSFLAPDDSDHAEGVTGQIWGQNSELTKVVECTIPQNVRDDCTSYAEETWVSPDWVKAQLASHRPLAGWFRGIPIEVNGQIWGVLLLDSQDTSSTDSKNLYDLSMAAFTLGKLLEGV